MMDSRVMQSVAKLGRAACWLIGALGLPACGVFRHVSVEPIATGAQRPSNVGAYVAVMDGTEPLTDLQTGNFRVFENEQLVPSDQTELTLLDPGTVAAEQAVLLMDMSQAKTPEARALAAKGAQNFVEKMLPHEAVAVLAFDGGDALVPIAQLTRGEQKVTMAALESFSPRDTSRNLNGAVLAGLTKLDQLLAQVAKPIKLGTLVVYASGPDVAGRADADKVHDAVWDSSYDVVMVGVGEQADALESLARRGLIRAQAADTLPIALEEAGMRAQALLDRHYLVSYCSPARAGTRRLRLEVTYTNKNGEEHHGDFETEFSANSFGPGCSSQTAPRLTLVPKEPPPFSPASKAEAHPAPKPDAAPGTKPSKASPDARLHDQGEDAPVAPPDQPGYAK